MKKNLFVFTLCIMFAALVLTACSSHHKEKHGYSGQVQHGYSGHFGDMDINGDDNVDWKEFNKHFSHAKEDVFQKVDIDNDGLVDHDEWHEFKDAHGYDK